MHQGELTHGLIELLRLALLIEEGILMFLLHEEIKLEITPLHFVAHKSPFAKDDGLAVGGSIGEGVALHDVAAEQITDVLLEFAVCVASLLDDKVEQPLAALLGVVGQQLDAIDVADSLKYMLTELTAAFGIARGNGGQFAA